MYQVLLRLSLSAELLNDLAVELSALILVVSWIWPRASNILLMNIAVFVLWNKAPVSTSATDDTTYFNNAHSIWIGALYFGYSDWAV